MKSDSHFEDWLRDLVDRKHRMGVPSDRIFVFDSSDLRDAFQEGWDGGWEARGEQDLGDLMGGKYD